MILTNTRPVPPWVQPTDAYYTTTFLVKNIRTILSPVGLAPPGELNVEYAREFLYMAPSVVWVNGE